MSLTLYHCPPSRSSGVLALLTELADTSLRRADQLANLVNAPVLSRIPYCEPAQGYPASSAGQVLPLA